MAGTAAMHPFRSETSTSKSRAAKTSNSTTKDAFEKKLATAKKTHAIPVVKPLVKVAPQIKVATLATKASADSDTKPKARADTGDPAHAEVTTKPLIPGKPKSPANPAGEPSDDSARSSRPAVHHAVAAVDPDAGHSQSHQQQNAKPKIAAQPVHAKHELPTVVESPKVVATPIVNGVNATNAANQGIPPQGTTPDDSTAPQDAQEQMALQPTFGTDAITTRSGLSRQTTAEASQATGGGTDAKAPEAASAPVTARAFAETLGDAFAAADHKDIVDPHAPASPTDAAGLGIQTSVSSTTSQSIKATTATPATPQARFAEDNHPKIVSGISGQLMPRGGTMQLRLEPPGLGSLQVTVHLRDGAMSAEFQTSSDEATRMLSHTLGQLKSTLETSGMSVEKLHVEQAPKKEGESQSHADSHTAPHEQQQQARQEKQRRDLMQRMWAKLSGADPLDMVA